MIEIYLLIAIFNGALAQINWNGNWAMQCDFKGNDLSDAQVRGEDCSGVCERTNGCTHYAWNNYKGGTCWMKSGTVTKSDAFRTNDPTMVCGLLAKTPTTNPTLYNIFSTRHGATEQGACELPSGDYNVLNPVALGNIGELQYLKFNPDLCGHILRINCGNGDLDIIVTNSNLGGGLDLYGSTWAKATNNRPPGVTSCSVQLTTRDPLNLSSPRCYYIQNEGYNEYYHNVALFNTGGRLITGAKLKERDGAHRGANPYYAFDVPATGDDQVTFYLNDGTSHSVYLRDCVRGVQAKQNWN